MTVELRSDQKEFVDRLVASGRFQSVDDAVASALALLIDDEQDAALDPTDIEAIRTGLEQADRGETISLDQAVARFQSRGINVR